MCVVCSLCSRIVPIVPNSQTTRKQPTFLMATIDYKTLHETLTSNNHGTTAFESTIVVIPPIISLYIVAGARALRKKSSSEVNSASEWASFFTEFVSIILPCIMCFTIMADYLLWIFVMMFVACVIVFLMNHTSNDGVKNSVYSRAKDQKTFNAIMAHQFNPRRRSCLTNYRAITNMLTVLCILAVDFHIFPRRFAKTETFGYGVMDLGVGLFIVANALVAPEARSSTPVEVPLLKTMIRCIPLLILGAGRVVFTSHVNYQEHVTEYGLHWNFFFTLAVTKLLCTIILKFIKHHSGVYVLLCVVLLCCYEIILCCGVQDWILSNAPRQDFISANREGLASNIGYVALYFGGVSVGRILQKWERLNAVYNLSAVKKLALTSVGLWSMTMVCENIFGISRRLANIGYFFWILSFTTTVVALLLVVEFFLLLLQFYSTGAKKYKPNPNITYVPNLLDAINMNGLVFFLIGNVLTGIINMAFKTFNMDPLSSLLIITLYMFVNCALVSFLFQKKIAIKL